MAVWADCFGPDPDRLSSAECGRQAGTKTWGKQKRSTNRVISRTVEYINGIKTFKLYNLIGTQFERLDDSFTRLKKDSIELELSIMPFSLLFFIVTSLLLPAALITGKRLFCTGL